MNKLGVFLILLLAGFSLYSNTLSSDFLSDDYKYIVERSEIKDITNLSDLWRAYNTRIVTGFSYALNYTLGGFHTTGYHIFNILIHITVSFLLYILILNLFHTPALSANYVNASASPKALIASLIFLCHPIASQCAAYVMQRAASMAALFYLAVIICYLHARTKEKHFFYILSLCFLILGCFTKELIITVPIILIVCEIAFFETRWTQLFKKSPVLILYIMVIFCVPLAMQLDKISSTTGFKNIVSLSNFDWRYVFAEINVLRMYIEHFFVPIDLSLHYELPIAISTLGPQTILSLIFLILLMVLCFKWYKRHRLFSFIIIWFYITTSIEALSVIFGNRGVMYDHWSYLALAGYALLISLALFEFKINMRIRIGIITAYLTVLCFSTYNYNFVFKNEIVLWADTVDKYPHSAFSHFNLAVAYDREGNLSKASEYYRKTLALKPQHNSARNNLGIIYSKMGDSKTAIQYFERALTENSLDKLALNNLAFAYFLKGDYQRSIQYYQRSISLAPDVPDAYFYLGRCYLKLGQYVLARNSLQKAAVLYEKKHEHKRLRETKNAIKLINLSDKKISNE